jgi:hypothetical protein
MWQSHLISHSFRVPVSRSLKVSLLASQPMESAAGGEPCGEPAISHDSHHVSLVQWTNLLPATRVTGSNPLGGYLCETRILLLVLSRYRSIFFITYSGSQNYFIVSLFLQNFNIYKNKHSVQLKKISEQMTKLMFTDEIRWFDGLSCTSAAPQKPASVLCYPGWQPT